MSRISKGHSPPRPRMGKKTLRRCRNNGEANDVILIDVDSENFDNVIIIDIPDSLPEKTQGSSMLGKDKYQFNNVINIDDDEISDSSPFMEVNNGSSSGTSSNREHSPVAQNFGDSATPVRLSKCKRTYSGKTFSRNRYGLVDAESDSDSSDDDYPDCVLVEDSSGNVQEQWEKAFFRRKKDIHSGNLGIRDDDTTSHFINKDNHHDAESMDETRQHMQAAFCSTSGKSNNDIGGSSPSRTKMDSDFGRTHLHDDDVDDGFNDKQNKKSDTRGRSNSQAKCHPSIHVEEADFMDSEPGCSGRYMEKRKKNTASFNFSSWEMPTKKVNHAIPIVDNEETSKVGACPPECDLFVDDDSCNGKSVPIGGHSIKRKSKSSFERETIQGRSFLGEKHNNVQNAARSVEEGDHLGYKQSNATGHAKEMGNLMPERCSFERSVLPEEKSNLTSTPSCDAVGVSGKSSFSTSVMHSEGKKGNHKETRGLFPEISLFGSIHPNEAELQEDNSTSNMLQLENKDGQLHSQSGDTCFPEETCLISEREKLKETDEYKRAVEEEWASRQKALLIQAEEAREQRRLRKRRKAESIRLLDMERRQKERIEEMRSIQKKDEENMNLKETIRSEVRNELRELEMQCKNMASLLHLLGIQVGSWPNPSPQEVQTAFKRALLTFHPDRAPRSDIRLQVEAEEKFKLINRLKEKLPPS